MKKVLVASILGLALSVTSSNGAGFILMQSYDYVNTTPAYSAISYGPGTGALYGQFIGSEFSVDLLYSPTGAAGSYSLVPNSLMGIYPGSKDGGSPTTDGAGIFMDGEVEINGYTAGSTAHFILQAFNGSSYNGPGTTFEGQSAPFAISGLQTSQLLPAGDLLDLGGSQAYPPSSTTVEGLQPFTVVPEPSASALAGLGAAALMIFRRRK